MARSKKLQIGVLNITTQPHSAEDYLNIFKEVYKQKTKAQISGDKYGILVGMHKLHRKQSGAGPITGDIFRYTNIDETADWFNTETNDFATDQDLKDISIPKNMKPNSARFSYIFFPQEHLLFYEGYYDGNTLGPRSAEKLFTRLLNIESVLDKYGRVEVTHIPERDALNLALKLPYKERLELTYTAPNPDTFSVAERKFKDRMRRRNVGEIEQTYKAISGQSIEIDQELKNEVKIAAKNGKFKIKGKDSNYKPKEYSTVDHPYIEKDYFDPDIESAFELMCRVTDKMKQNITEWFRSE